MSSLFCKYFPSDCGSLTTPSNGSVTTSDGVTTGDSATYSCDPGYQLSGVTTRQCLENEGWNGTQPTCDSGILYVSILPSKMQRFAWFICVV